MGYLDVNDSGANQLGSWQALEESKKTFFIATPQNG
jgi:hypothetical protein